MNFHFSMLLNTIGGESLSPTEGDESFSPKVLNTKGDEFSSPKVLDTEGFESRDLGEDSLRHSLDKTVFFPTSWLRTENF